MAPKKPNPMEDPPAASSSDDEEEETEEEGSSSEEEDDDEETPEPTQPSSPLPQQTLKQGTAKKTEAAAVTPQSKTYSSEEETGSESESDSEPDNTPKPIATKPMEETAITTKPRSKPVSKRPNDTDGAQKDAKRAKKGKDADADEEPLESKKPGEDTKKQLFQRLWSEDDEIAVLKGMIEFSTKKGVDPNQDMNAFHDFIKKSLHVDVSRNQLMDKIRRLKKKYENNIERDIKKGEDRLFSKPHEQQAYFLSKKVWGGEASGGIVESAAKSNGKALVRKFLNHRGNSKQLAALKAELLNEPKDVDNDKELSLKTPVDVEKFLFGKSLGVAGLEDYVIKNGLDLIGGSKKMELEQRWKKLQIAQLELYVERIGLVKEQATLMLESLKSSDK